MKSNTRQIVLWLLFLTVELTQSLFTNNTIVFIMSKMWIEKYHNQYFE